MKYAYWSLKLAFLFSPVLILRVGGITLSDYLFVFAFIIVLIRSKSLLPKSQLTHKFYLPNVLIFVSASLSMLVNPDKSDSLITLIKFIVLLIFIPWTIRKLCFQKKDFHELLKFYCAGLLFFSTYTVYMRIQKYGFSPSITETREKSLAEHVTDAGGICSISFLACLIFMKQIPILFKLIVWTLTCIALIFTGSVSGYMASFIGIIVYIYRNNSRAFKMKNLIFGLMIGIGLFAINKFFNISNRINHATSGRYDTSESRIENWRVTLESSFESLKTLFFGRGLNPKNNTFLSNAGEILGPHNIFLQCLSAAGVFFAIGVSIYLFQILKVSISNTSTFDFYPLLVTSLVFSLTSPLMYSRYIWLPFLLALHQSLINEKNQV